MPRFVRRLPQCLEINKSSPYSNQHLPPMLVSRADACPRDGEQRRKTSCNVAMPCESNCLKNSSQHPESDQAKYHKKNGIEHGLVPFGSCCSTIASNAWGHRFMGIT